MFTMRVFMEVCGLCRWCYIRMDMGSAESSGFWEVRDVYSTPGYFKNLVEKCLIEVPDS